MKYSSPTNNKRACLCPDNTYSKDCCDGSYQAQGIGVITLDPDNPSSSTVVNEDTTRTIVRN